jgi:hypothetical protein
MLSPEDAEKVLTKNLANVIRKANSGKPLTAAERALLEQQAAGGTLTGSSSAFAKTWDELAQRLNVSRKTLQNVEKRAKTGEFPDLPKPRADGRHDVASWSAFFVKHNIARSAEDLPPDDAAALGAPITVTDWKAREVELKCAKLELENGRVAGELVLATDVEAGLSTLVASFRQALNNLPARVAQKGLDISDYHELEQLVQEECNVVLRTLQTGDFLDPDKAATLATAAPVIAAPDQADCVLPDQKRPQKNSSAQASKRKPAKIIKTQASPSIAKATSQPAKVIAINKGAIQPVQRRKKKRRAKP